MKKYITSAALLLSVLFFSAAAKADGTKHWHSITATTGSVSIPANSVITYIGVNLSHNNLSWHASHISIGGIVYVFTSTIDNIRTNFDDQKIREPFYFTGEMFTGDKPKDIVLDTESNSIKMVVSYYTVE